MRRISAKGRGRLVCTQKDLLDLGSRAAVDQALLRLVKNGSLRRVGHGLYDFPRFSAILNANAPVDIDAAIDAIARRDGVRIMIDGLTAANALGLTTAVPAKVTKVTDGASRKVKVAGHTIHFRHASPRVMFWTARPAAPVVQALLWLGQMAAKDPLVEPRLKRVLPNTVKKDLADNKDNLPSWIASMAQRITAEQTGA